MSMNFRKIVNYLKRLHQIFYNSYTISKNCILVSKFFIPAIRFENAYLKLNKQRFRILHKCKLLISLKNVIIIKE